MRGSVSSTVSRKNGREGFNAVANMRLPKAVSNSAIEDLPRYVGELELLLQTLNAQLRTAEYKPASRMRTHLSEIRKDHSNLLKLVQAAQKQLASVEKTRRDAPGPFKFDSVSAIPKRLSMFKFVEGVSRRMAERAGSSKASLPRQPTSRNTKKLVGQYASRRLYTNEGLQRMLRNMQGAPGINPSRSVLTGAIANAQNLRNESRMLKLMKEYEGMNTSWLQDIMMFKPNSPEARAANEVLQRRQTLRSSRRRNPTIGQLAASGFFNTVRRQ